MSLYEAKLPSLKDQLREEAESLEKELEKKDEKEKRSFFKIVKKTKKNDRK